MQCTAVEYPGYSQNLHIDFAKEENWTLFSLHGVKRCECLRGDIGIKNIRAANEKRRAFYKTSKGLAVKETCKKKAAEKRQINQLSDLKLTMKASLQLKTIQNFI